MTIQKRATFQKKIDFRKNIKEIKARSELKSLIPSISPIKSSNSKEVDIDFLNQRTIYIKKKKFPWGFFKDIKSNFPFVVFSFHN
jgi:hypothetical protein